MIISHEDPIYIRKRDQIGNDRWNGAYYYSKEIVENIIPNVKTDRNWITIKVRHKGCDHSICFVHNNLTFEETYDFMHRYSDVVYVVGLPDMVERARKFGRTIYLPLSVDVNYVKQFRVEEKTKDIAFVGRRATRRNWLFPEKPDYIEGLPREELLREMAKYHRVYAIGRTAIEARILGCNILPFHPRLMDPSIWKVLDNREAADILQKELDNIDS